MLVFSAFFMVTPCFVEIQASFILFGVFPGKIYVVYVELMFFDVWLLLMLLC